MDGQATAGGIMLILLMGVLAALYFMPTIVAFNRRHPQRNAILAIDIFLGWTLVGWVVALAWSLTAIEREAASAASAMKRCPECAERVQFAARKCRFCGYVFDAPAPLTPAPPPIASPVLRPNARDDSKNVAIIVAVAVAAGLIVLLIAALSNRAASTAEASTGPSGPHWARDVGGSGLGELKPNGDVTSDARAAIRAACHKALNVYSFGHSTPVDAKVGLEVRIDSSAAEPDVTCQIERKGKAAGEIHTNLRCARLGRGLCEGAQVSWSPSRP